MGAYSRGGLIEERKLNRGSTVYEIHNHHSEIHTLEEGPYLLLTVDTRLRLHQQTLKLVSM